MDSPKKAAELSKAVLNVTTYKPHPDNEFVDLAQFKTIDITNLLEENGIDGIYQINGVSSFGVDLTMSSDPEEEGLFIEYAITEEELTLLEEEVSSIVDAAIVNEKQGKAVKKLIGEKFKAFLDLHSQPIKECSFVKDCYDKMLGNAMKK